MGITTSSGQHRDASLPAHGFLLHQTPYKESDFKAWLFLKDIGIVPVFFKQQVPQLFRPFEIKRPNARFRSTQTDYRYIGSALVRQPRVMFLSLYLHELIFKLHQQGQPSEQVFSAYMSALTYLEHGQTSSWVFREFEKIALMSIGSGIDYAHTFDFQKIHQARRYRFDEGIGFRPDAHGRYTGGALLAIHSGRYDSPHALACAREIHQRAMVSFLNCADSNQTTLTTLNWFLPVRS